jgi:hypothetical protein
MGKWGFGGEKRKHRYVEVRLSAYVDHEVSDRERRRIETHLAHCPECRAELRALRWTVDLLHQAPPVKAPRRFVVREADLARERQPVRRRAPLPVTQWATAVVALLFVLVLGADLLAGRGLPRAASTPLARGEREMVIVTQVVEKEVAVQAAPIEAAAEEAVEQQADQVARAMPGETAPPMPTLEAQVEAEAAPAEGEGTKAGEPKATGETPMAMKAPPELGATEAATVTEEAAIMLAQPEPSPTPGEPGGGGGLQPTPAPLPTEPPEAELQPKTEAREPELTERLLPTPSQVADEYGLGAWDQLRRDELLWRVAEVSLGIALLGLLIAVVWMRSKR